MRMKHVASGIPPYLITIVAVVLAAVSCAERPPADTVTTGTDGEVQVTFTYRPEGQPGEVCLAGSFNNWDPGADRMNDDDGDGIYEITLPLDPGGYQYKFVIDGTWKEDPHAASSADDGYGGKNELMRICPLSICWQYSATVKLVCVTCMAGSFMWVSQGPP